VQMCRRRCSARDRSTPRSDICIEEIWDVWGLPIFDGHDGPHVSTSHFSVSRSIYFLPITFPFSN